MTITPPKQPIARVAALIDRLRPSPRCKAHSHLETNLVHEAARLASHPAEAEQLGATLRHLLALPDQAGFYAESGVRSALGSWLEFLDRVGQKALPLRPDDGRLNDILRSVFRVNDAAWVLAVDDAEWVELARRLGMQDPTRWGAAADAARANVLGAIRLLSYRVAGASLDRELLQADPSLERADSPFLAQSAALWPLLEQLRHGRTPSGVEASPALFHHLDQCDAVLLRVRHNAQEKGISVRLTYHVARLQQLIERERQLLRYTVAEDPLAEAVHLFKVVVSTEQARDQLGDLVGENVIMVARNITDHASRRGEHYIAEDRTTWWATGKAAAGAGVIIAIMAVLKVKLALLHLPPLTEGVLFGASYSAGFVAIHLLGLTVATKQPAMTAASIAATIEDSRGQDLGRLADLSQNVLRTQHIAVLGNVVLALPVAVILSGAWAALDGEAFAPAAKAHHLLSDLSPLASGSLWFAAVAGVGLFLSGLVAGYFDNQARYRHLPERVAAAPGVRWCGPERAARVGAGVDEHYGAVCGNVFFGMYLGLMSAAGPLTGLPLDIRHVAFAMANIGIALTTLGATAAAHQLPNALIGVVTIGVVNLVVSFALALFVAMKSRGLGAAPIYRLAVLLLRRFARDPVAVLRPPA